MTMERPPPDAFDPNSAEMRELAAAFHRRLAEGAADVPVSNRVDQVMRQVVRLPAQFEGLYRQASEEYRGRYEHIAPGEHVLTSLMTPEEIAKETAANLAEAKAVSRLSALERAVSEKEIKAREGLSALMDHQEPRTLRAWLDNPRQLLLLLNGPTGTGKSFTALATAAEAAVHGYQRMVRGKPADHLALVRAVTQNDYILQLRPNGSDDPDWMIRNLAHTADILVLDDLGAELDKEATEHTRRELVELMDQRMRKARRTIITSNLFGPKEFAHHLGDRLTSRLLDVNYGTVISIKGDDLRRVEFPESW